MSVIDLFLIGFFVEKPWNAYELAKFIAAHDLQEMIRISTPAVYKNLVKLAERGYLDVAVLRETALPEKKIYSITEQGLAYFRKLLNETAELPIYHHFDCNTVVMHLNKVEKAEGLRLLDRLRTTLQEKQVMIAQAVEEHRTEISLVGQTIIRQGQLVNAAMLQWIDEFIAQYTREELSTRRMMLWS